MAKRKIDIFQDVKNEKELEQVLEQNPNRLICAEIYCSFAGPCTALDRLFQTIKLDWSDGQMILLKVLADDIEALQRFHGKSQPFYVFIYNKRITKVFRGVDAIRFGEVAKKELHYFKMAQEGNTIERRTYDLSEPTPEEVDWISTTDSLNQQEVSLTISRQAAVQAERKMYRAELMVPHLQCYNFVLFWPHAHHAHPELYERWDMNNIIMVGREVIQLDKQKAEDVLYAGDAPMNEASLYYLLSGPALAICFRLLDQDKHFVSLVRYILYEEIPAYDDDIPSELQQPKTAFDIYKSFSPTKEEIWSKKRQDRIRQKEEEKEKRARRLSEMQRLARQAIEEAIEAKQAERERLKLELLKSGKVAELEKLRAQSEDYEVDIEVPEELPEEKEESSEEEDDPNEYFPPPHLLIPGFYAPPNDIAKANGLAILFPKLVKEQVSPIPEFLPPHVLVLIAIHKRHKAIKVMAKHKSAVIHLGVFRMTSLNNVKHVAYTVKQFDAMQITTDLDTVNLAFMVSVASDLPLLELTDLSPVHVSRHPAAGSDECAAVFPVRYTHPQEFEDFDSVDP